MSKVFIVATPIEVDNATEILGYPIIYSGIGKINATMAVYKAIHEAHTEIINIGSCGSSLLPPGELIEVGQVYQDIDLTPLAPYGENLFETNSKKIELDANSSISCFTTDYFMDKPQKSKYSKYYLDMIENCSIFDMECFALAKVCKHFNIKFNSYKWVSDDGDGSTWEENCKIGFNKLKIKLNEDISSRR
tara:strand:- start:2544 stop:3116 length:573 start_codon:yes stop_codon:yes gene_type:complete